MNAELSPFAARMLGALQSLTAKNEPHPCGGFTTDDMQWKMGVAFTGGELLTAALEELIAAGLIQYAGDDEEDAIGVCYELVLADEVTGVNPDPQSPRQSETPPSLSPSRNGEGPTPILIVLPKGVDGERFSRDRLESPVETPTAPFPANQDSAADPQPGPQSPAHGTSPTPPTVPSIADGPRPASQASDTPGSASNPSGDDETEGGATARESLVTLPGVETAMDAIEQKTAGASTPEAAGGWRHAGLVVRLFKDVRRALLQLRHHAGFTSSPDKAAAYREAAAILSQHTGVSLIEPETVSPPSHEPELFQFA